MQFTQFILEHDIAVGDFGLILPANFRNLFFLPGSQFLFVFKFRHNVVGFLKTQFPGALSDRT